MDNVKALEILKESAESSRLVHKHLLGDNVPPSMKNSLAAIEVAIDAVGKQIPKPVEICFRKGYILPSYFCPDCGEEIGNVFRYKSFGVFCMNCGQRLSF